MCGCSKVHRGQCLKNSNLAPGDSMFSQANIYPVVVTYLFSTSIPALNNGYEILRKFKPMPARFAGAHKMASTSPFNIELQIGWGQQGREVPSTGRPLGRQAAVARREERLVANRHVCTILPSSSRNTVLRAHVHVPLAHGYASFYR